MKPDRPFVELHELAVGSRFMFFADDLKYRGPCTLLEKGAGSARINYEPHQVTKSFRVRDRKTGALVEKSITSTLSGESRCALGAHVIPIAQALPLLRGPSDEGAGAANPDAILI
jgi:hypothetical protein